LACGNTDEVSKVSYTKKDLVKYFVNYHLCKNADYSVSKSATTNKTGFRFKIGTNLNSMKMDAQDNGDASKITFSKENSVGVGAEVEVLMPFNNYKWGVFVESNYYSYKTTYSDNVFNVSNDGYIVDYKTIELPIGVTYYMNLNSNNRLFLRGAFVPHLILDGSYIAFNAPAHYNFKSSSRMFFGVGYNYQRLAMEFRYYSTQDITQNIYKRGSNYSQISFRLSFVLFQNKIMKIK
jgi:hypothetical protein